MELFGFKLGKQPSEKKKGETFVKPVFDDGAIEVDISQDSTGYAAQIGYSFDLDRVPEDEYELQFAYRNLALQLEVDEAIQEIINEAIITDDLKPTVAIVLDDVDELSESIKDKISDEFDYVLKLLDFKNEGYGIFRKWYIDGKLYYHKVLDKSKLHLGVTEIIPIDPLNMKFVREYKKKRDDKNLVEIYDLKDVNEYFVYSKQPLRSDAGKTRTATQTSENSAVKIPKDAITYIPSGLRSSDGKLVLSHLYKAIKPFNNLRLMEDSVVIYRVTRAPERRIFYVDVGNLPKGKAEQYLKDVMNRFKNKIVYDSNTGAINNRKKFASMIEDYWLPRREGGRGTEVSTLPGGDNLGELADVEYFRNKLYKALNVPSSRFESEQTAFNVGRTTEITRDEISFSKFINRLRKAFSLLFTDLLKTQCIIKKILTEEEWRELEPNLSYSFLEDNYFQELKEIEVWNDRVNSLMNLQQTGIIGKYMSHETVRKEILKQSEETIKAEDKLIQGEQSNEILNPSEPEPETGGGY